MKIKFAKRRNATVVILNTCVSWCRALTQILKEIYPILDKEKTRDLFRVFTIKLLFKLLLIYYSGIKL